MRRACLILLLLLCLGLAACTGDAETVSVWYGVADHEAMKSVAAEEIAVPEGKTPLDTALEALFAEPEDSTLYCPAPEGVVVRSAELEDGLLTLDLSAAYGELAGLELSIANACIVLTLTDLPEVEAVRITVRGEPLPFQEEQVLSRDNILYDFSADD